MIDREEAFFVALIVGSCLGLAYLIVRLWW
jgi:hypothetical protein